MRKSPAKLLRQLAQQLGVNQPFLPQTRAGKRPLPESLECKIDALGAYQLLITKHSGVRSVQPEGVQNEMEVRLVAPARLLERAGAGDGIRTHDNLLGKQVRYHCVTPASRAYSSAA